MDAISFGAKRIGHGINIIENNDVINEVIKNDKIDYRYYNYKEAFSTNYCCHLDEWGGISRMFECLGIPQYDKIDFADLNYKKFDFEPLFNSKLEDKRGIFVWDKGKLYFHYGVNEKEEVIYTHFQKRKMENNISHVNCNRFIIVPNQFIDYCEIVEKFFEKNTTNKIYIFYYNKRIKNIIKNIKNGAINQKVYRIFKKIKQNIK